MKNFRNKLKDVIGQNLRIGENLSARRFSNWQITLAAALGVGLWGLTRDGETSWSQKLQQYIDENFRIELSYDGSSRKLADILAEVSSLRASYLPTPWIYHFHLQSIYNVLNSRTDRIDFERELLRMPDGGQVSLDWVSPLGEEEPSQSTKILFIVHGLTGGSNMNYIKYLAICARNEGFRCVAYNSRGINTEMTSKQPFNGADLSELDAALRYVHEKYPQAPIFGVGTSFGGNMLFRWSALNHDANFLRGLIGLATPFDIAACIDSMGFAYEKFFVNRYKANCIDPYLEAMQGYSESHGVNWNEVYQSRTLRKFHESITIKIFNYESADHYFHKNNIHPEMIQQVNIPTLLLFSKDDPIVSANQIPEALLLQNPNLLLASTTHGAHVCWFEGLLPKRWYPKPTLEFCNAILKLNY